MDNWSDLTTFVCQTCMYFTMKDKLEGLGRCRRHAPGTAGAGWPVVYPTDWCGDHKLKTCRGLLPPEPVAEPAKRS